MCVHTTHQPMNLVTLSLLWSMLLQPPFRPCVHAAYIRCTCGLHPVYMRLTSSVHAAYIRCTCGLHQVYMRLTSGVHVAYIRCTCGLHPVYMRLTCVLYIQSTTCVSCNVHLHERSSMYVSKATIYIITIKLYKSPIPLILPFMIIS